MKPFFAPATAFLGLACLISPAPAQEGFPVLPALPSPLTTVPPLPAPPLLELSPPPAPVPETIAVHTIDYYSRKIWDPDAKGLDYRFYGDVGLNYMRVHGGNPSGPLTGSNFSAGVLNDRGLGVGVSGSELFQSTTRSTTREVLHKP